MYIHTLFIIYFDFARAITDSMVTIGGALAYHTYNRQGLEAHHMLFAILLYVHSGKALHFIQLE